VIEQIYHQHCIVVIEVFALSPKSLIGINEMTQKYFGKPVACTWLIVKANTSPLGSSGNKKPLLVSVYTFEVIFFFCIYHQFITVSSFLQKISK
jgi:hypothetical protein